MRVPSLVRLAAECCETERERERERKEERQRERKFPKAFSVTNSKFKFFGSQPKVREGAAKGSLGTYEGMAVGLRLLQLSCLMLYSEHS